MQQARNEVPHHGHGDDVVAARGGELVSGVGGGAEGGNDVRGAVRVRIRARRGEELGVHFEALDGGVEERGAVGAGFEEGVEVNVELRMAQFVKRVSGGDC